MKKAFKLIVAGILMCANLAGCTASNVGQEAAVKVEEQLGGSSQTQETVEKEIVFAASRNQAPGEMDAHYCSMYLGVWEPLITKDEKGAPLPALATEWQSNEDATEWIFKIRENVSFHNGVILNAQIVAENFERYKKGPFSSAFYGINIETTYPNLKEVEVVDEYTIKLMFSEPCPLLDYNMANYGSSIFEPSCFGEDGNFISLPIGTGPYKLVENKVDEYAVIERNETYYGELAETKTIRFKVIPDANTRYSALLSGEVQGLCDIGAITPSLAGELDGNTDFKVLVGDSTITHYLNLNGNRFPFNDQRMREGLSLLLNREEIIQEFYNGHGIPAGAFLTYTSPFYKEIEVKHDIEKGKKLIQEVIGEETITLEFLIPVIDANRYPYQEQAEYMQAVLKEIGIDCNITLLEWGACQEQMKAGDYDMCLRIKGLSNGNPHSHFESYMHTAGETNINYNLGYSNKHVDELIEKVALEIDENKIREIYGELQEISAVEFPNIPILYTQEIAACSSQIEGFEATTYGLVGYTQVKWNKS